MDPGSGVVVPHLGGERERSGVAGDLAGRDREQELGAGTHEVRGAQVDDRSVRDLGQGPQLGLGREPLGVAVLGDQPDHVAEGAGDGHGVEPVAHAVGVGLGGHRPRAVARGGPVLDPGGEPVGAADRPGAGCAEGGDARRVLRLPAAGAATGGDAVAGVGPCLDPRQVEGRRPGVRGQRRQVDRRGVAREIECPQSEHGPARGGDGRFQEGAVGCDGEGRRGRDDLDHTEPAVVGDGTGRARDPERAVVHRQRDRRRVDDRVEQVRQGAEVEGGGGRGWMAVGNGQGEEVARGTLDDEVERAVGSDRDRALPRGGGVGNGRGEGRVGVRCGAGDSIQSVLTRGGSERDQPGVERRRVRIGGERAEARAVGFRARVRVGGAQLEAVSRRSGHRDRREAAVGRDREGGGGRGDEVDDLGRADAVLVGDRSGAAGQPVGAVVGGDRDRAGVEGRPAAVDPAQGRVGGHGHDTDVIELGDGQLRAALHDQAVEAVDAGPEIALGDGRAGLEGQVRAGDRFDLPGALRRAVGQGDLNPVVDEVGRNRRPVSDQCDAAASRLGVARAERGQPGALPVETLVVDDQVAEGGRRALDGDGPGATVGACAAAGGRQRAQGQGECTAMLDGDRAAAAAGELPSSTAGFDRPDAGEVAGNGQPDRTAGPGLVGAGACGANHAVEDQRSTDLEPNHSAPALSRVVLVPAAAAACLGRPGDAAEGRARVRAGVLGCPVGVTAVPEVGAAREGARRRRAGVGLGLTKSAASRVEQGAAAYVCVTGDDKVGGARERR